MAKITVQNLNALKQLEGKQLPESDWLVISQEMINEFASATKDNQWIHTDVERARKASPFGRPVAHGFLSLSLISKFLHEILEVSSVNMGVNYGLNKVRFPAPVMAGSKLRLSARIAKQEAYADKGLKITWYCTLEIEKEDKPACVAEFISLMFE